MNLQEKQKQSIKLKIKLKNIPFKSKDQVKWMFSNEPKMAEEWAAKTKDFKVLPKTQTRINRRKGMAIARSKKK